MKTENSLRKSYEKQKAEFDAAREKKIKNLELREQQVKEKLLKLEAELSKISMAMSKEKSKTFQSFEDFFRTAKKNSEQSGT